MTELNLSDREHIRLISELENEILELIDDQDEFTRSDLQGAVMAIVIKILRIGQKL
jgi:hypothetical protein